MSADPAPRPFRRQPPLPRRTPGLFWLSVAAAIGAGAAYACQLTIASPFGASESANPVRPGTMGSSLANTRTAPPLPGNPSWSSPASPSAPAVSAIPVPGASVRRPRVVAPGKVEPVDGLLNLAMDTPGVLARVVAEEGRQVAAGQLLAELVNDEPAARVKSAECELASAAGRLALLNAGTRSEEIDEARHQWEEARATADHLAALCKDREALRARRAATDEEVEDLRCRFVEAARRRDAAAARLARLKAGSRPEEIAIGQAAVALARSRLAELKAALDRTRLTAPRAGTVLRVLRREGESVMGLEASPILMMADLTRLQVRAELDESQVGSVAVGDPVTVRARGLADRAFTGRILRIGGMMGRRQLVTEDPRERVDTRVLEVIVSLDACDGLKIGQRVDVER